MTSPPLTVEQALRKGTEFLRSLGIEAARLEMELIMAESMGLDRLHLYLNLKSIVTEEVREKSREMLGRRRKHEPLAYILGHREFYGLPFEVTSDVLVPRPETELLVDRALKWIEHRPAGSAEPLMVDIGTGSGAIAVAAAHTQIKRGLPGRWIATDVSESALVIARRNAEAHGVMERVEFRVGSLFEPLASDTGEDMMADCICSNPPYIAKGARGQLAPEITQWEPQGALFAGEHGMDCIGALIAHAARHLRPQGSLFLEIGSDQGEAVRQTFAAAGPGLSLVGIYQDHAGLDRIVEAGRGD